MGSAERHLTERDPPDNPAVGFRQTSPSYRVKSDPFRNVFRAEERGKRVREEKRREGKGRERRTRRKSGARVKTRPRTSRWCCGQLKTARVNSEGSAKISRDRWSGEVATLLRENGGETNERISGDKWGCRWRWRRKEKEREGKGEGEKWDILKGFPDQQLGNCLISHLFRFSLGRRAAGAFYLFRSLSRRRFSLT